MLSDGWWTADHRSLPCIYITQDSPLFSFFFFFVPLDEHRVLFRFDLITTLSSLKFSVFWQHFKFVKLLWCWESRKTNKRHRNLPDQREREGGERGALKTDWKTSENLTRFRTYPNKQDLCFCTFLHYPNSALSSSTSFDNCILWELSMTLSILPQMVAFAVDIEVFVTWPRITCTLQRNSVWLYPTIQQTC